MDSIERLLPLLDAVHDTVAVVRARCTEYFDHQPLRLRAATLTPPGAGHGSADELADRLGQSYGVPVRVIGDEDGLTAVDRLVEHRAATPGRTPPESLGEDARPGTQALFDAVRREQRKAARHLEEQAARCAEVPPRRVGVMGGVLSYHAVGESDTGQPAVVVLNALGMGLGPWHRLVALLSRHHRVIAWAPRGCAAGVRPLRLDDQVDDLTAVLNAEGVRSCHLLAWCTGPKVALEFHRRDPGAVRSMVFLNGSFRRLDRPGDPDTAYEQNLEAMCRSVAGRPTLADVLRRMLGGTLGERLDFSGDPAPHRWAEQILASPPEALSEEVRRPFADGRVLVAYARQLLDFWSRNPLPHAPRVTVPVLGVTGELDRIAAPERLERDTGRFPDARHVRLPVANHYVMHDRPHELAALLADFFARS